MKENWRWFGPDDPVPLDHIKQAGATGIVSALHHFYRGEAWPLDDVLKRRDEILAAGFTWSVVESIPIHNSIKLRSGPYRHFISAWKDTLAAVANAGVQVICYNFMPVVDWTRTDLRWRLPTTGYALRFDAVDFAAYDLFILERKGAEADYPEHRARAAHLRFDSMSEGRRQDLEHTIIAGLPGAEASYNRETIRSLIAEYEGDDCRRSAQQSCCIPAGSCPGGAGDGCSPRHTSGRSAVVIVWPAARRLNARGCAGDSRCLRYARQRADVLCRFVWSESR